jgi:hypothetical protein
MLRPGLRFFGSLALCVIAACSSAAEEASTPVESADANLDYRATNGKEFDVAGRAEVKLEGADAALEGEARSAKLEELARLRIDAITRALDAELWKLWPEDRRQNEKNIVAMIRMASPKRGDFMVEGNAAAFSYWAQVAGPNDLLSTLPLVADGDKRLTKLTVDGAEVVLEWSEAAETADAYPRYAEMFEDGVLDIAIHVGGDHYSPRNDLNESQAIYDELLALGMRSPVSSFADLRLDSAPFEGSLAVAGKQVVVRATLVHADMAPDDKLDDLVTKFKARAKEADVVVYRGHAGTQLDYSGVVVHYEPRVAIPASDFDWLDLPRKYQLFVFDGCETYTGYADKLLENTAKDETNADIITSVNYGSGLVRAESVRALLHALLDKTGTTTTNARWVPRSWDAVLKRVNDQQRGPWTSIYGVHGLADNPRLSMLADASKIGTSCRLNADCGGTDSLCVATQSGRVCGAACTDDSACPTATKCTAVNSRTLGPIKQCLPPR